MSSPCLRETSEGVFLKIKLQPRASRNKLGPLAGEELRISVTAPPVDSAANQALLEFLVEELDCPRGAVQLVKGHASRHKTVFLSGLESAEIARKLGL